MSKKEKKRNTYLHTTHCRYLFSEQAAGGQVQKANNSNGQTATSKWKDKAHPNNPFLLLEPTCRSGELHFRVGSQ